MKKVCGILPAGFSEPNWSMSDIIDLLPDATFALDLDGQVIAWNSAMEHMSGKKAKDMIGKGNHEYNFQIYGQRRPGISELLLKPDPKYERLYTNLKRMKDTITAELFVPDLKGKETYLWMIAKPLYSPKGWKIGVVESIRDITQLRRAQTALKDSETRYRTLFETSPDGIVVHDGKRIRFANPAALKMMGGTSVKDAIGRSVMGLVHPTSRKDVTERIAARKKGHYDSSTSDLLMRLDGTSFEAEVSAAPIRFEGCDCTQVVFSDITERRKAEAAMKDSELRFRRLFETSQDGVLLLDFNTGQITDVNPFLIKMLGYSHKEFIGKKLWEVSPFKDLIESKAKFMELQMKGFVRYEDLPLEAKNGKPLEVEFVSNSYDVGGKKVIQCNVRDITSRRAAEEAAERGNRFVSLMMECNDTLVRETDELRLLDTICRMLTDRGGYLFAWVGYAVNDTRKSIKPISQYGLDSGYLDTLKLTWADEPRGRGPAGTAIRSGQPSIVKNIATEKRFSIWRKDALKRGYLSAISVPLVAEMRTFGVLNIYSSVPDAFDKQEVDMLTELADDIAYGIMSLRNREALKQSESRFRSVFQNSSLGMLLSRPDYRFVMANHAAERILGYSEKELQGKMFKDITHPDDLAKDIREVRQLGRGEIPRYRTEKRYVRKDGKTIWGAVSVSALSSSEGQLLYFLALIDDISLERELEDRLRSSEKHLSEMIDFLPDATFAIDLNGRITVWNRAIERMTGRKAKDMIGKGDHEYAIPFYKDRRPGISELLLKSDPKYERKYLNLKRAKDSVTAEMLVPDLNGKEAYLWMTAKPLYSPEGEMVGVIEGIRDITELRKKEEELMEERDKAKLYLDIAGVIIIGINCDGRVMLINKKGCEVLGYPEREIIGKDWAENFVPKRMKDNMSSAYLGLASGKKGFDHFENPILTKSGEERLISWYNTTMRGEDGGLVCLLSSGEDITELKRNQDELVKQKEQVEVLSRLKDRFMADLTHELKTPLSVILLHLNMIRSMDLSSEEADSSYALMLRNALRLSRSIDQIMQLTKLDSITVVSQRFSVYDMARSVCGEYQPLAKSRGINLSMSGPDINMWSDKSLLSMILSNLVSNAIKFTEKGDVRVTWTHDKSEAVISVMDTGIGIQPENRSKLFTMFFKEHHDAPGSGIGLSISSEIIKRLGGRMEYKPEPHGSTFMIIIPKEVKNETHTDNRG